MRDTLHDHLSATATSLSLSIERHEHLTRVCSPCTSPLALNVEHHGDQVFVYFSCRTSSWYWAGERTDVHDVFSVYVAARLSATGLGSCRLLSMPHPAAQIPGELYVRYIIPDQPRKGWYRDDAEGRADLARLITALHETEQELHLLVGRQCDLPLSEQPFSTDDENLLEWADDVADALGQDITEDAPVLSARIGPDWFYYRSTSGMTSVVRSLSLVLALQALADFPSETRNGASGRLMKRGPLRNAYLHDDVTHAREVLRKLNLGHDVDPLLIPVEDHLVAVAGVHVLVLAADAGVGAFDHETEATLRSNDAFVAWARPVRSFQWASPIDASAFEQLAYDMLMAEPNVQRVRFVGSTTDRDRGRDLLVDLLAPPSEAELASSDTEHEGELLRSRHVIVQCKSKRTGRGGVGEQDVLNIRDTCDHHGADGYWLLAWPHVTAPLIERLEGLRNRYAFVDWWGRREMEECLRRNPRLLDAHAGLVTPIQSPPTT